MITASPGKNLLQQLRTMGFSDEEIVSLISRSCSSMTKTSERHYLFWKNEIRDDKNDLVQFATIALNKHGKIEVLEIADEYSSAEQLKLFLEPIIKWYEGKCGQFVLSRPLFSLIPLTGKFSWNDRFQIRPLGENAKIGKGLNWFDQHQFPGEIESYLGPPFPFILEVKANKSDDTILGYHHGLKLLTEYEALLTVLLVQQISTARKLMGKRWTSVWDGKEISYHLLHGGFDTGEESTQDDFSSPPFGAVKKSTANDYYNHLFGGDGEILLPQNIAQLLKDFDTLTKPMRNAFLRACYWFSLGIENRQESSLAILSFSTAIENLLPRQSSDSCSICGKSKGKGPTKLFKEHLERYAPILPALKSRREKIYSIRSALIHGSKLDAIDLGWLSPLQNEQENANLIEFVARKSLVNWLADPLRTDPTS